MFHKAHAQARQFGGRGNEYIICKHCGVIIDLIRHYVPNLHLVHTFFDV